MDILVDNKVQINTELSTFWIDLILILAEYYSGFRELCLNVGGG